MTHILYTSDSFFLLSSFHFETFNQSIFDSFILKKNKIQKKKEIQLRNSVETSQPAEQQLDKCLTCQTLSFELSSFFSVGYYLVSLQTFKEIIKIYITRHTMFPSIIRILLMLFFFLSQRVTASFSPNCPKLNAFATTSEKVWKQLRLKNFISIFNMLVCINLHA